MKNDDEDFYKYREDDFDKLPPGRTLFCAICLLLIILMFWNEVRFHA